MRPSNWFDSSSIVGGFFFVTMGSYCAIWNREKSGRRVAGGPFERTPRLGRDVHFWNAGCFVDVVKQGGCFPPIRGVVFVEREDSRYLVQSLQERIGQCT